MKKSRSKALKKLAEQLHPAYIKRQHTEYGKLYELHDMAISQKLKIDLPTLTEENANEMKSITYPNMEVLNHHRRLKKAYTKNGTKGVQDYIVWLKEHNENWIRNNKGMGVKEVDQTLFEIAKGKAGSFWNSLIMFLFAFAKTFLTKDKE